MAYLTRDRLNVTLFSVQCSCPWAACSKMAQANEQKERLEKRTSAWQWNHSMTEHLMIHAAAHKQITSAKWLITLTQIDDSDDCMVHPPFCSLTSSYQPFQQSEKGTDPGQPRLTQTSPSPGSCKRKIRRWTDPGRCTTQASVKRP